ncbi:hypothetical protein [Bartonella kosoyi]|uniref:hypothetical protein n=1 Tax=Bartonella kosoyi TaxID=2133959 RepID=UPI001FCEA270|nr:hypothetical protein [Bartonella kosoyi]
MIISFQRRNGYAGTDGITGKISGNGGDAGGDTSRGGSGGTGQGSYSSGKAGRGFGGGGAGSHGDDSPSGAGAGRCSYKVMERLNDYEQLQNKDE